MKKIQLKLDDLRVESFTTAAEPLGRGTVAAHQISPPLPTVAFTDQLECTLDTVCLSDAAPCQDNLPYSYNRVC